MPTKFKLIAGLNTAILLFVSFSLFAQGPVTGRVISNADQQPISGATVQIKGTKLGTQTGTDGSFSITTPRANSTLVITVVGFEPLQIPLGGQTALGDIVLSLSASSLNDVVVTGYTSQKKKDITGAVAVVDIKNLKSVPGTTTEALLQGQAAGVTIINSGQPGGGSNVRIRGITGIGSVDPLVIVDGVQSSMHDLNVADIESIQVLKDAGSTAIYGIQGSNGVIIVTTKRGKGGKASISYDGYYGTQRPLKNGFNLAGSQNWADVFWLQYYNAGIVPGDAWFGQGGPSYAPPTLPAYLQPTPFKNGAPYPVNPNYTAMQNPTTYDIVANQITKTNLAGTDWFHEIFKPAVITQHTISAANSTERSSYYFSLGYLDQEGTLIGTHLKRYNVRANSVFNVKDHVRIGENAYIFYKDNPTIGNQNEGNAISLSYRIPPVIPVYDVMGNYAGTHTFTVNNSGNPVADQLRGLNNKQNDWQMNGNIFAEADFFRHFTIRTSIGGTLDNDYYYYFGYTPYENAEGSTAANNFTEGSAYQSTVLWTNTLTYNQIFGKHSIKALIGTESKSNYARGLQGQRSNYFSNDPNYWSLNTGAPSTQGNSGLNYAYNNGAPVYNTLYSQFGRVDYAFEDKYLLSGTIRRDQSSLFLSSEQTGIFPSGSAGWRISQENFMKDVSWLKDLKLRGSYGITGNLSDVQSTNPYNLYSSGASNSYYDLNGTSTSTQLGFFPSHIANPLGKWEKDILADVGVDISLNKFDATIDWFQKKVSGLLFQAALPNTVGGASAPYVNFGNIQNTGIEAMLAYHGIVSQDLRFDITGTITHYKSDVLTLPQGIQYYAFGNAGSNRIGAFSRLQPGHAIGEFYGYKVTGYFKDAADVAKSPAQSGAAPGEFKYADINHSGAITDSDRTWIGNPNPKFTYGLNLALTWKNFDFSAFFYGSYGNDVFNYIKYWTVFPQVFEGNVQKDLLTNSWTPTNLNPKYPQITNNGNLSNSGAINSWYVENGSYLRLKSLNIGYSISPAMLKKIGVDRLRIYVQGANLFTITKYTGLDPELSGSNLSDQTNFGIDLGNYPANQKNYNVGINLTF
jgi:TonB-dependent starch-binding outer membrane protein SusC